MSDWNAEGRRMEAEQAEALQRVRDVHSAMVGDERAYQRIRDEVAVSGHDFGPATRDGSTCRACGLTVTLDRVGKALTRCLGRKGDVRTAHDDCTDPSRCASRTCEAYERLADSQRIAYRAAVADHVFATHGRTVPGGVNPVTWHARQHSSTRQDHDHVWKRDPFSASSLAEDLSPRERFDLPVMFIERTTDAEGNTVEHEVWQPGVDLSVCGFRTAWHKPCDEAGSKADGRCPKHTGRACTSCAEPAERECSYTGAIAVCGAYLCARCEHSPSGHGHSRIRREEAGSTHVGPTGSDQPKEITMSEAQPIPLPGERVLIEGVEFIVNRLVVQDKGSTHHVGQGSNFPARPTRAQMDLIPVAEAERRRDNLNNLLDGVAKEGWE